MASKHIDLDLLKKSALLNPVALTLSRVCKFSLYEHYELIVRRDDDL